MDKILTDIEKQRRAENIYYSRRNNFINDTEENIRAILDMCIKAGVKGIICFDMGLTLRDGNRQYFYQKLDEHFPGMKEKYIQAFGDSYYCTSPANQQLMKIFAKNILMVFPS